MATTNGAPAGGPAPPKSPWLDAHTDVVACIRSHTACLQMVALAGDSDYRLLVADFDVRARRTLLLLLPLPFPLHLPSSLCARAPTPRPRERERTRARRDEC